MFLIINFLSKRIKIGPPNYLNETGSFRIHKDSKTSKYEEILFKEER